MSGCKEMFRDYYEEINNLSELLGKYVNAYRLLIGGAAELNNIASVGKGEIKEAVKRASDLGDIIDELLDVISATENNYLNYVKLKGEIIGEKKIKENILTEIDEDILMNNS